MSTAHEQHENDIAIVGMAARLPGASDVRRFWRNLRDGVESVRALSDDELLQAGVRPETLQSPSYVKVGVVLDGMEDFDAEFFGFSPKEAAIMDPQHRHFLECAWEALEDAGHPPERFGGAIGVFAGCGMQSYMMLNLLSNQDLVDSVGMFLLRHTGNDKDFLATRASYELDLRGPSVNVQTACSTSLVAVHLAVQSLLSGESDMALAGGVTIEVPHRRGYVYKEGEILSPDGHCRAFDHRSKGTLFGSGVGIVVLRRLEDALADGDHVYAVIKGSAVNNDGSGKVGYLAPSVDGQSAAIAEALAVAGLTADDIRYVEAHGTGTPVGDPIEISALTRAFRQTSDATGFCGIGSVKTNIGHLDTAAGVASLIKATLAIEHGELPPSLNWEAPNPRIDFESSPFYVNHRLSPWRGEGPRRAGVNSLGVGGTNAHVVLEQAPPRPAPRRAARRSELLQLSARSKRSLDEQASRLAAHLREHPALALADVAHTLRVGRRAFPVRRVLAARDRDEAIALLESGDPRRVFTHRAVEHAASTVFLFPGGGAQYPDMGRGLCEREPVYREELERGLATLVRLGGEDLHPLLAGSGDRDADALESARTAFHRPSLQLPALFVVELALARLWMSKGIVPEALIGHSMGENAAACLAGVISYEDALGLVLLRGRLFERVPEGGMLSVPLAADELRPLLGAELDLAVVNGPELCVASGPRQALDALAATLAARDVEARPIPISIAAHSRMLEPILDEFRTYLRGIRLSPPEIPFVSNSTGTWITDEEAVDPDYWVDHLRHTVRFADGLATLLAGDERVFVEIGPGRTLGSLVKLQPAAGADVRAIASLRHPDEDVPDELAFEAALGRAWACGLEVDLDVLAQGEHRRVPLPGYAFQHARYWIEPGVDRRGGSDASLEIARHADEEDFTYRTVWRETPIVLGREAAATSWLVFLDGAGVGRRLADKLREAGNDVAVVHEGDAYYRLSADEYSLSPEHGREGYDALVRDLAASGRLPQHVVHLWTLTADESFRPGSSFFHHVQERGFYSLFFLAQALGDEGARDALRITVVSNGMQRVHDEELPYPEKATLLGPVRVVPRELAGVTCSSVDVTLPAGGRRLRRKPNDRTLEELGRVIEAELAGSTDDAIVAWRDGRRFVQRVERERSLPRPDEGDAPLRERGVYLITGGLGGIGLVMAEYLARTARARIVLVGRTPMPDHGTWDLWLKTHGPDDPVRRRIRKLRELEELGAELMLAAADVTDVDEMRAVVAEAKRRFGAVHGVLHTAGVLRDDLLLSKTQSSVEEVFTPKVHGTLVLDRIFERDELDFMLLFSSTSVAVAPAGQVDYVAANAFLDAWAQARSGSRTRTTALAWGVWSEVGMAAEAAQRMGRAEPATPPAPPEEARHPLFETRLRQRDGTVVLSTRLSPDTNWMLDEHRTLDGRALLPGTGFVELAAAALSEIGESVPFEVRDLLFLAPLFVEDGTAAEVRVVLRTDEEGYGFALQSRVRLDTGKEGWRTHAQARLLMHALAGRRDVDLAAIEERCTDDGGVDEGGLRSGQEDHLRFGPRWRVLRERVLGDGEGLARLELPAGFEGDLADHGLHPALLDYATGWAMDLIRGYDSSTGLWVPVSYESLRVHAPLGRSIRSWVRSHGQRSDDEIALFDVTLTDERGAVLVEIERFAIHRLDASGLAAKPVQAADLEHDAGDTAPDPRELSPAQRAFRHNLALGLTPEEGCRALERVLRARGLTHLLVSSLPIEALSAQAEALARVPEPTGQKFARPQLASDYVEPRDGLERTLVGFWEELLGVGQVGVRDDFFDLGGHSLIAVRLFAKIRRTFAVDFPISVLFEAPTIERCAALVREATGGSAAESAVEETPAPAQRRTRYKHLVAMHADQKSDQNPFFLVAGMFGNVLNLRHLANLVGSDRPFWGLQARGLYGDHQPHETFEEMAADYLTEVRSVRPHGPYLLGGFSGGGITAYEMARQLRAEGEEVALLVLLDTPLPKASPLSAHEKALIHWQRLTRKGPGYLAQWAKNRVQWELGRLARRFQVKEEHRPSDFHSDAIEAAFRRALGRYELVPQPLEVTLFRPKLDRSHVLGKGRVANAERELVWHDNGWSPWVSAVAVHEVPGDHDSMVLEPNVRVLATRLRGIIEDVEVERGEERGVRRSRAS